MALSLGLALVQLLFSPGGAPRVAGLSKSVATPVSHLVNVACFWDQRLSRALESLY
jgi:hypothetical protein